MHLVVNKSMKNIYIVGLLCFCSTWAMAEAPLKAPEASEQPQTMDLNPSTIKIVTRPEIMGLWGMEILIIKNVLNIITFEMPMK